MGTIAVELPHRSHRRAGLAAAVAGVVLAGALTVFALATHDDDTTPASTGIIAAEPASHAYERAHRQAVIAERNDPLVTRYGRPTAAVREADDPLITRYGRADAVTEAEGPLVSRYGRKLVPTPYAAGSLTLYGGRR
jgi:hypothetical protein